MSETETTVPMDDKALFDAATSDPTSAAPAVETPQAAPEQADAGPARDEAGRFAPKAATEAEAAPAVAAPEAPKPPAQAEARQEPPPGWIPAWRAREIADARAAQIEAKYARSQPQEEIDPYADPAKFRDAGVQQAIDPIQRQLAETREYYSRENAFRVYGQETVQAAYKWLEAATHAGDPRVATLLQRVTQSIDPYREVVAAYKRESALSTVGDDPEAWFNKELERRKASDPEFAAKHLTPAQSNAQNDPKNVVRLPPSLNRQPGSAGNSDAGSMNDADLFRQAMQK